MEQWPQIRHKSVYNVVSNEVKLRIVNIVNIPVSAKAMATIQPCWMDRSIVFLSPDHSFLAIDRHCAFFFSVNYVAPKWKKRRRKGKDIYAKKNSPDQLEDLGLFSLPLLHSLLHRRDDAVRLILGTVLRAFLGRPWKMKNSWMSISVKIVSNIAYILFRSKLKQVYEMCGWKSCVDKFASFFLFGNLFLNK